MRQVPILNIPPTSDIPAFLEWVKQTLSDMSDASAENVFEPETLDVYAKIASPAFTGTPTAPTPTAGDNDTSLATTAFVQGEIVAKAPLASPAFTGNPIAPTPTAGDNDTSIATTAFVAAAIAAISNTITEFHGGIIAVPTNKAYTVILKIPVGCTITETVVKSLSGTCTATIAVDGVNLGGAAHAVSSTEESIARSSANTVAAGADVTLTVSANASCLDLAFTIKTTRTIA